MKIKKRNTKFDVVYTPVAAAMSSKIWGKMLAINTNIANISQKIESSSLILDFLIFLKIKIVVRIDTTKSTILSIDVMELPIYLRKN